MQKDTDSEMEFFYYTSGRFVDSSKELLNIPMYIFTFLKTKIIAEELVGANSFIQYFVAQTYLLN